MFFLSLNTNKQGKMTRMAVAPIGKYLWQPRLFVWVSGLPVHSTQDT